MGLAEWFRDLCSNILVHNTGIISSRYRAITRRLNTDFWDTTSEASHSLYVGSYGRNTAIDGISDIDMVFELPSDLYHRYDGYTGNGQSSLLQAVRNSIQQTYSNSSVGGDGQVVIVSFSDGLQFEIVPVFSNNLGTYTYPDSNGGGTWRTTNPRAEIDAIRTRNNECNENLVRLCRMMRAWKRAWNVPIGGLLIDTLAYQFIGSWQYRDKSFLHYDYMCRDFFNYLKNQDKEQEYWRAPGSHQYVYRKGLFQSKAGRCYNISLEAIEHELARHEWSAKQKWREIFGDSFPS